MWCGRCFTDVSSRGLLSSVGLSSYETAAEAWCHQMGAAHLAELAEEDNLKSFGEALGSKGGAIRKFSERTSGASACQFVR